MKLYQQGPPLVLNDMDDKLYTQFYVGVFTLN